MPASGPANGLFAERDDRIVAGGDLHFVRLVADRGVPVTLVLGTGDESSGPSPSP